MNESAIRLEEQIISLFPDQETLLCQGWILKKTKRFLIVYPLYYKSFPDNIRENVRKCERISRQYGVECVFRIVERTNYYLSSVLADNEYGSEKYGVVGEWSFAEDSGRLPEKIKKRDGGLFLKKNGGSGGVEYLMARAERTVGIRRQELLLLQDGYLSGKDPDSQGLPAENLSNGRFQERPSLENIIRFSTENGIRRILADIPQGEELPEQYIRAGFYGSYFYRCYQKKDRAIK